MRLDDYLNDRTLTLTAFAKEIGVSVEAVRRYAGGKRHPRPAIMRRIVEVTGGKVGPQDFLDQDERAA